MTYLLLLISSISLSVTGGSPAMQSSSSVFNKRKNFEQEKIDSSPAFMLFIVFIALLCGLLFVAYMHRDYISQENRNIIEPKIKDLFKEISTYVIIVICFAIYAMAVGAYFIKRHTNGFSSPAFLGYSSSEKVIKNFIELYVTLGVLILFFGIMGSIIFVGIRALLNNKKGG